VTVPFEKAKKRLSHLGKRVAFLSSWVTDESVASALVRAGFSAGFLLLILCPVPLVAFWAMLPNEAFLLEEWKSIIFRRKLRQLLALHLR
jgi:hypothetical protein